MVSTRSMALATGRKESATAVIPEMPAQAESVAAENGADSGQGAEAQQEQ